MAPKLKNLGAILKFLGAMAPKITKKSLIYILGMSQAQAPALFRGPGPGPWVFFAGAGA